MGSFSREGSASIISDFPLARNLPDSQHSRPPKSFGSVKDMVSTFENNGIVVKNSASQFEKVVLESNSKGPHTKTVEIPSDTDTIPNSIQKSNFSIASSKYSDNSFLEVPKKVDGKPLELLHTEDKSFKSGTSYSPVNPYEHGSNALQEEPLNQTSKAESLKKQNVSANNSLKPQYIDGYIINGELSSKLISNACISDRDDAVSNSEVIVNLKNAHKIEYEIGRNINIKSSHIDAETALNGIFLDDNHNEEGTTCGVNLVDCNSESQKSQSIANDLTPNVVIQNSVCIDGIRNAPEEKKCFDNESKSTWDEESLSNKCGYKFHANFPDTLPFDDTNCIIQTGKFLTLQDTLGENPLEISTNVLPSNLRRPSVIGKNSKASPNSSWRLGDIDGLEKTRSLKSYKPGNVSLEDPRENLFNEESNDNHSFVRKVSFRIPETEIIENGSKDEDQEFNNEKNIKSFSNSPDRDPESGSVKPLNFIQRQNFWRIICISLTVGAFIFYVILLTYNFFFEKYYYNHTPYGIKERDIYTFFAYAHNETRYDVINKLIQEYNIKPDIINPFDDPSKRYPKKQLSPRYNDTNVITVNNSFDFINKGYLSDIEVETLMESDELTFMFPSMAYSPAGVIEPQCGCSNREVLLDIARLSKVTGTVRTYGTQCRQAEYILEAIKDLHVNVTLSLGVWIGKNDDINRIQLDTMKDLVKRYPKELFHSIYIGNEVLFRNDLTPEQLVGYITETKGFLSSLGLDIPVGTSEIGSKIASELYRSCDFVGANIHPFFSGLEAQHGTTWVLDYYYGQLIPARDEMGYDTKLIVSEVGWPYAGGDFFKASAGISEFQQFLNDWLCTAPAEILNDAVFFESFDQPWKSIWWDSNKKWETEWGFFTSDRNMKDHVYIPNCSKYGNPGFIDDVYNEDFDPYEDISM